MGVIILLLYWLLCLMGNPSDPFSLAGWFGTDIDKKILGIPHMYKGEGVAFDPEGIMSTLPAIVQVLFGYFVGNYIQQKGKNHEMLSSLMVAACVLVFTGFMWDQVFPINKKIWTSSYVLYTSGLAIFTLGVVIYLVEFKEKKPFWGHFFIVFGKNPLFIFFLSGFLPRLLALLRWPTGAKPDGSKIYTSTLPWFYNHICKPIGDWTNNAKNGSLLFALFIVTFMWLIASWMDRKKWYVRV